MDKPPTFAGLEGLLELSQHNGVDIRPTLLRVLTDQYVQSPSHTLDEERHYTELALRLIDATDLAARVSLAKRLARYPLAPRAVMQRLARDAPEVAEIIARPEQFAAQEDVAADNLTTELCELFFAAGAPERRLILLNLDYASIQARPLPGSLRRTDIWRLESAALQHNLEAVVREIERALGVSNRQARRIVNDELGEPIVVAAKAMEMPTDVLQRMLLFVNPTVGRSVDRVYQLAGLYGEITSEAARRLVAIWCDADRAEQKQSHYEPTPWHKAAENARRALSEIAPRPAARPAARVRDVIGG